MAEKEWITVPEIWYQGTKSAIGPTTIDIYYSCEPKERDGDKDFKYDWRFYVNDTHQASRTYSGKDGDKYCRLTIQSGEKSLVSVSLKVYCTNKDGNKDYFWGTSEYYTRISRLNKRINSNTTVKVESTYYLRFFSRNSKSSSSLWGGIKGLSDSGITADTATYISDNFSNTATNWLKQWRIWRSWYDQKDYSLTSAWDGNSLTPTSPISAKWYNACAKACNGTYQSVSVGEDIKAIYFRDISDKVTTWT